MLCALTEVTTTTLETGLLGTVATLMAAQTARPWLPAAKAERRRLEELQAEVAELRHKLDLLEARNRADHESVLRGIDRIESKG